MKFFADRPEPSFRQSIFNIPAVTKTLLVANIAVHGFRLLLPEATDDALVHRFAFIPARYTVVSGGWTNLVDPISYQFLHANWTHLLVNMLALLAFSSGVERRMGGGRMLALSVMSGIAAAGAHLAIYPTSTLPVIGASGAISGLFGGILRMQAHSARGKSAGLWPLLGLWMIVTVVAGQMGLPGEPGALIAWVAHLGGLIFGLLTFGLFDRPPRTDGAG